MKVSYVIYDEEKLKFLQETLKHLKDDLYGQKIQTMNNTDIFINSVLPAMSTSDFVILDFNLFNNDIVKAISKIRGFERRYDSKYIILTDSLTDEDIEEFRINNFYNLSINGNKQILIDILEGKVDENYTYGKKTDEEKIDEDYYIFKNNVVNIEIACIDQKLDYLSFLTSINIANYIDRIKGKAYYVQFHSDEDFVYDLYFNDILIQKDDYYVNEKNNVIYSIGMVPHRVSIDPTGFHLYDLGYFDDINNTMLDYDMKIIISDSNIANIKKIKEIDIKDNTHVLIVDALLEQKEYINSLNIKNLKYVKGISSICSVSNSEVFREMLKDFIDVL